MRALRTTGQFERDVKRLKKRGFALEVLWEVVELLRKGDRLPPRHRPHKLTGEWRDFWECHVRPDWLLIWSEQSDALVLVRTGTHADLFG